jgi:hypothetical protein
MAYQRLLAERKKKYTTATISDPGAVSKKRDLSHLTKEEVEKHASEGEVVKGDST